MGNGQSTASVPYHNRMEYQSLESSVSHGGSVTSPEIRTTAFSRDVLKMAFNGIWSVETPNGQNPVPRRGHFYDISNDGKFIYTGYGTSHKGETLNDIWGYDLKKKKWQKIETSGDQISPRSGATCCIVDRKLVIYGGYNEGIYYSDLHTIDIDSGFVKHYQTTGNIPSPRAHPYTGYYNGKLFLYGGSDGTMKSDFYSLEISTLTWRQLTSDITWYTSAPFARHGNLIYSYGGASGTNIMIIDMENECIKLESTIGASPVNAKIHGGLVYAENYLFCFGGESKATSTLVYCLDLETRWWFVYHFLPDNETTTIVDGEISQGIFLLPAAHSFGIVYDKDKKCLNTFFGHPLVDPPPISSLYLGDSLPVCTLRKDMIDCIRGFVLKNV